VPPTADLSFDVDAIITAGQGAKAVFLCNPNNPTGKALPIAEVARLVHGVDGLVILDEAYFEFWGESAASLIRDEPRVIVVRTFSKAFSLAGARIGYALCDPEVAELANRMRPPNSISYISAILAEAAARDITSMRENVAMLSNEREWLTKALRDLGIEMTPSRTNFVLTKWPAVEAAEQAAEATLRRGLVPRTYPGHPILGSHLRFTVRTRSENEMLVAALAAALPVNAGAR
jgi:histidinol-phosphate aminotransferase